MDKGACTKHTIRESELEQAVLTSIQKQVELAVEMDRLIETINCAPAVRRQSDRLDRNMAEQEKELDRLQSFRRSLYEDWKSGDLTREEYHDLKERYDRDVERAQKRLERMGVERRAAAEGVGGENALLQNFRKHLNITELTREILIELVDQILVHEGKKITICFKFADEYKKALEFIESNQVTVQTAS